MNKENNGEEEFNRNSHTQASAHPNAGNQLGIALKEKKK